MSLQSFDDYLADTLATAKAMREARDKAEAVLSRHTANGYASLTSETWGIGRPITKAQYDALMVSLANYTGAFWSSPGFNGTNIESALTEIP